MLETPDILELISPSPMTFALISDQKKYFEKSLNFQNIFSILVYSSVGVLMRFIFSLSFSPTEVFYLHPKKFSQQLFIIASRTDPQCSGPSICLQHPFSYFQV